MSQYKIETEMSFAGGRARFFAKAREGMVYPLGSEKRHVVDGEVVGGGGPPAFFQDHLWSTDVAHYAAGMVKQAHFMDPEGYMLDPSCLPVEALAIWPTLDRKRKQLLCLHLIEGLAPEAAVALLPPMPQAPATAATEAPAETFECPVGCGVKVEGEADPGRARAAILTHVRLMHPDWKA